MSFEYVGSELEVFKHAINWKRYWGMRIAPYLGRTVLEVGAGIGGTTSVLCTPDYERWTAIEPDAAMLRNLKQRQQRGEFGANCVFREGTVQTLAADERFESIIYIDVLEHIEDDQQELANAAEHLAEGGHLIVLSPAFPALYTPFDEAIGHYRRYTRQSLRALTPPGTDVMRIFYLDSVGMLASLGNLLLLSQSLPSHAQIRFWDRVMVPISRLIDPLVGYRFGRSVVSIWRRG